MKKLQECFKQPVFFIKCDCCCWDEETGRNNTCMSPQSVCEYIQKKKQKKRKKIKE
jgi:hypothetical protein